MSLKTVRNTSRKLKSTVMFVASFALALGSVSFAAPQFLSQTAYAASTWNVSSSGGACTTTDPNCLTIQSAINAAGSGDTINVAPGTYNESLNITTSVILKSTAGRDNTFIKSLTIATSGVTVNGFTIEGVNASNVARANIFLNSGVSNITISNNKINVGPDTYDNDNEVGLLTTSNLVNISDNLNVTGNIFQASNPGSYRAFYINPGVNNFTFSGNAITGNFAYTATTSAKNGLVDNNTITGAGGSAGFRALGEPDPAVWGHTTFSGNTVSGVARGITVDEANNVTITGNNLSGNEIGVRVVAYTSLPFDITTISVHNNNLSGEDTIGYGVTNNEITTPTNVNATCNWWGAANGPGPVGPGTGSNVTAGVTYTSWLTTADLTGPCNGPLTASVTTDPATSVQQTTATINGTNGPVAADNTSFWWGTTLAGPFTAGGNTTEFPSTGWSHDSGLGSASVAGTLSEPLTGLTLGTTYYFVAWVQVNGTWYPGAVQSFTTAPAAPVLSTPASGTTIATNDFWFTWNPVTSAASPVTYQFQSSMNSTEVGGVLTNNLWTSGTLADPSIHSTGAPDGTWYWQVRAIDAAGNKSAWSNIWNVTLDTQAPVVPTATLKAGGANVLTNGYTSSNTFTFNLSSVGATRYQLKYWNDISGSSYKVNTPWNPTTLNSVYPDKFTQGEGTHYFAFSACDAAGNCSAYSAPFVVTYDNTTPIVTFGKPVVDSPTGSWTPKVDAGDATSYHWIADTSNPAELAFTDTAKEPTFVPSAYGNYSFTLVAMDAAGNKSDAANFSFSYSAPVVVTPVAPTPAPTAAFIAPAPLSQNLAAFAATPAAADDTAAVLGATTTKDAPAVAGAQTSKKVAAAATNNDGNGFASAWYWLLAIPAAIGAGWWATAAYRRRDV